MVHGDGECDEEGEVGRGEDGKGGARRSSQAMRADEEEVEGYVHKDAACEDEYNAEGVWKGLPQRLHACSRIFESQKRNEQVRFELYWRVDSRLSDCSCETEQ